MCEAHTPKSLVKLRWEVRFAHSVPGRRAVDRDNGDGNQNPVWDLVQIASADIQDIQDNIQMTKIQPEAAVSMTSLNLCLLYNDDGPVLPDRDHLRPDGSPDRVLGRSTISAQRFSNHAIMLRTGASKTPANSSRSFDRKAVPDDSFDDIPCDEDEDIVVSNIIQSHGSREGVDEAKQINP